MNAYAVVSFKIGIDFQGPQDERPHYYLRDLVQGDLRFQDDEDSIIHPEYCRVNQLDFSSAEVFSTSLPGKSEGNSPARIMLFGEVSAFDYETQGEDAIVDGQPDHRTYSAITVLHNILRLFRKRGCQFSVLSFEVNGKAIPSLVDEASPEEAVANTGS